MADAYDDQDADDGADAPSSGPEAVDDELLAAILKSEYDRARDYTLASTADDREQAIRYYNAEKFGDETEGRSQLISTDVRDTIRLMLPQVMRAFWSAEKNVVFEPIGPEDEELAAQATDFVNEIVLGRDNPGFEIVLGAIKDALREKTGFIKFWWQEDERTIEEEFEDIDDARLGIILAEPGVEILGDIQVDVDDTAAGGPPAGQAGPPAGVSPSASPAANPNAALRYDVKIRRREDRSRIRLAVIPPEEVLITPDARSWRDGRATVVHRTIRTVSELVEMGYDYEDVVDLDADEDVQTSQEQIARDALQQSATIAERTDAGSRRVLYCEFHVYVDRDGDGRSELRRVCTGGSAFRVLHDEAADDLNLAVFRPDPEAHTPFGHSIADLVADIQKMKSHLWRAGMDSLAVALSPRIGVVETQANVEDVLNNEIGAIIRMKQPGMVQPFAVPDVSGSALTALGYADDVIEKRTGISKAAAGLDADVMQSTTKAAVTATLNAAQGQIELLVRILAETGFKQLYQGVLRLLRKHQVEARTVRLRGQWVQANPMDWDEYDVRVDVGIGRGNDEDRLNALGAIALKQEQILQTLGPDNPLCGLTEYRTTLAKMVEIAGFKNAGRFFKDPAQTPPSPPQGQQPDPNAAIVQVEMAKVEQKAAADHERLQLDREKMMREDDRARDQMDIDTALRAAELRAKYGAQVNEAQIRAMVDRDREAIKARSQMQIAAMQPPMPPAGGSMQ